MQLIWAIHSELVARNSKPQQISSIARNSKPQINFKEQDQFTKWKLGGWITAQYKCAESLGWDISCSYHVLQLLSSLTSRSTAIPKTERSRLLNILYQAIIMQAVLSSKERFTITQRKSASIRRGNTSEKTFESLKPARRAQVPPATLPSRVILNPPGSEASYPAQSAWHSSSVIHTHPNQYPTSNISITTRIWHCSVVLRATFPILNPLMRRHPN